MSFGFSVGDFLTVGQLTWTVYRACKGAPGDFQELSRELSTLHTILHELEDEAKTPTSLLNRRGGGRKAELVGVIRNLEEVLREIEDIVTRYQSLGRDQKKTWDRVKFAKEDLTSLRSKLLVHVNGINVFMSSLSAGSLARIEAVLDELIQDIKAGRKEPTVISANDETDEVAWSELERELIGDGITKQDVERYKDDIKEYLKKLILENLVGIDSESTDSLNGDIDVRDRSSRRSSVDSENSATSYDFMPSADDQSSSHLLNRGIIQTPEHQPAQPVPITQQTGNSSPFKGPSSTSPPPLPEGWIAYLDKNSGKYYYIHLPTQETQWTFPEGPPPSKNDFAPLSPMPPPRPRYNRYSLHRQREDDRAEALTAAASTPVEEEARRPRKSPDILQPASSPPVSVRVKVHGGPDGKVTLRRLTSEEAAAERRERRQKDGYWEQPRWKAFRDEIGRAEREGTAGRGGAMLQKERRDTGDETQSKGDTIVHRISARPNGERSKALPKGRKKTKISLSSSSETDDESPTRVEVVKTASLKDLFKVSITSSLPVKTIQREIGRVMREYNFSWLSDIPGGGAIFTTYENRIKVYILKIPLVSLHGIQFKRFAGWKETYEITINDLMEEIKLALR